MIKEGAWAASEGEPDTKGKFLYFIILSGIPILNLHCEALREVVRKVER